jgi:hypothetical protein
MSLYGGKTDAAAAATFVVVCAITNRVHPRRSTRVAERAFRWLEAARIGDGAICSPSQLSATDPRGSDDVTRTTGRNQEGWQEVRQITDRCNTARISGVLARIIHER